MLAARLVPLTASASNFRHISFTFFVRSFSDIPAFNPALILSVTSSIRTKIEAVILGLINSSAIDCAQKPSCK